MLSSAVSKQQSTSQQQSWDVWVLFWWNQHCTKAPQKSPMRTGSPSVLGAGQRDGPGSPLQILPLADILTGDIIGHVLHMRISKYKISYELLCLQGWYYLRQIQSTPNVFSNVNSKPFSTFKSQQRSFHVHMVMFLSCHVSRFLSSASCTHRTSVFVFHIPWQQLPAILW